MSRFLQLHYLTVYPPSNPNRDDLGQPKTVVYGGKPRLRLSSQAIKRAARLSDVMQNALNGHLGVRTQRLGEEIQTALIKKGSDIGKAKEIALRVADVFGKIDSSAVKKNGKIRTKQLAFVSPDERNKALEIAYNALNGEEIPEIDELKKLVLRPADGAVDIAMFGRMLADDPEYNREAAVQVSHSITTHQVVTEDDFYTAVDDLKIPSEDAGAGFVGQAGFGSGVFYTYVCVNNSLLIENLSGNIELARVSTGALAEALAISTPSGKRNSFAHQTRASYILAESGDQQPRSLAGAFFYPVVEADILRASIRELELLDDNFNRTYGPCSDEKTRLNVLENHGTLDEIKAFARNTVNA